MLLPLLLACPRPISPELELGPPAATTAPEPEDPTAWRAWVLRGDPLGRHPRQPQNLVDPSYTIWAETNAAAPPGASAWWFAEARAGGTASTALLRGARLAALEVLGENPGGLLPWLVPLAEPTNMADNPRPPLDWLGGDAVRVAERAVLLGWLDGPAVDVTAAAAALQRPDWARLADTPSGQLVLGRVGDGTPDLHAHASLEAALRLQLAEATRAPDTAVLRAEVLRLGGFDTASPPRQPAAALLAQALPALAAAAHDDTDAGLALVATTALRLQDACADAPCTGFDRLPTLTAAARFGPVPARAAALVRVLAWDAAVDTLWSAWGRAQVTRGMDAVAELLTDVDPRGLDRALLLRPFPDPGWILPVTRALGGPEGTSKEALFRALYARVATEADAAARVAPDLKPALDRMASRARSSAP